MSDVKMSRLVMSIDDGFVHEYWYEVVHQQVPC